LIDAIVSATANINGSKTLNNSIAITKLQTVVGNANMLFTHLATTGVPTAALLVVANVSATANINGSILLYSSVSGAKIGTATILATNIGNNVITQSQCGFTTMQSSGRYFFDMSQGLYIRAGTGVTTTLAGISLGWLSTSNEVQATNQQIMFEQNNRSSSSFIFM
jgi:hypothetical protein